MFFRMCLDPQKLLAAISWRVGSLSERPFYTVVTLFSSEVEYTDYSTIT